MRANLELYRIFCEVVRCGSLSRAARELFVSQSAVSQAVSALEKQLDCALFVRSQRGVTPTERGKLLYSYADRALGLLGAAEERLDALGKFVGGELKIGASDTLCHYFLLPRLERFHEEFPDVRLHVANRTTPDTIGLLKKGEVDIALVNLPVEEDTLEVREIRRVHDIFVAGARFSYLKDKTITLEEAAEQPLILLERSSNSRRHLDQYAARKGVTLRPEIELGAHSLLLEFARIGLGIACVTREFCTDELKRGEVFPLRLKTPLPERAIGLVWLKGLELSAGARRFVSLVSGGKRP